MCSHFEVIWKKGRDMFLKIVGIFRPPKESPEIKNKQINTKFSEKA